MDKALIQIHENLGAIRKVSQDQTTEFWLAKDLMLILGYSTWRQFKEDYFLTRYTAAALRQKT